MKLLRIVFFLFLTQITHWRNLPIGLTKIFDFVRVNPDKFLFSPKISSIQRLTLNLGLIAFACSLQAQTDSPFEQITTADGLLSNRVFNMVVDERNELFVLTDKGVCKYNGLSFENIKRPKNSDDKWITGHFPHPKYGTVFYSVDGSLFRIDGSALKELTEGKEVSAEVGNSILNSIATDSKGQIYFNTIIDGKTYSLVDGKAMTFSNEFGASLFLKEVDSAVYLYGSANREIQDNKIKIELIGARPMMLNLSKGSSPSKSHFKKLHNNTFLFAKDFELLVFDKTKLLQRVFLEKNIQCLMQDSQGKIWIGLLNGGVKCFSNAEFLNKSALNYLGDKTVTSLVEDDQKNIWISTEENGIFLLSNAPKIEYTTPKVFSRSNEKTIEIINQVAKSEYGNIAFSKPESKFINTEQAESDSTPPKIYITGLKILGKDTTLLPFYELDYEQNIFKINFAGMGYLSGDNIQYRYMLVGLDKSWNYTGVNHAEYTSLPPGQYQFIVSAINKKGIWSDTPASLAFKIKAPFWKTTWFKVGLISFIMILLSAFLILYIKYVKRKEREKAEVDKKMANLELQALRSQMNPHFIFNTMTSIQNFIASNETEDALNYLSKFAKLIRKILENSSKNTVSIKEEIENLTLYLDLEKMRFHNSFDYEIMVDPSIDEGFEHIPPLLIQPLAENAILHGLSPKKEKGHLKIELIRDNDFLICAVTDNGIGRKKAMEIKKQKAHLHESKALSITAERLRILNDKKELFSCQYTDLFDAENNPTGTRVEIKVPL